MYSRWTGAVRDRLIIVDMTGTMRLPDVRADGLRRVKWLATITAGSAIAATAGIWAALPTGNRPQDTLSYLCRSSGLVLVLFYTATVVLGLLVRSRTSTTGMPRFALQSLHRNLSLMSLVLLAIHVLAPVIGGYLGLTLAYAFVPLLPAPVRIWTRLAATALDLTLALALVSATRRRFSYRAWRALHLTSYLAWLLGIVHAIGIGSDRGLVLWCDGGCVVAVCTAGWFRFRAATR